MALRKLLAACGEQWCLLLCPFCMLDFVLARLGLLVCSPVRSLNRFCLISCCLAFPSCSLTTLLACSLLPRLPPFSLLPLARLLARLLASSRFPPSSAWVTFWSTRVHSHTWYVNRRNPGRRSLPSTPAPWRKTPLTSVIPRQTPSALLCPVCRCTILLLALPG